MPQPLTAQLHELERRYEELGYRMSAPDVAADAAALGRLNREYKTLAPIIEAGRAYLALQAEMHEEEELLKTSQDAAFNEMVQQELRENRQKLTAMEDNIRLLLLPRDENDEKSVVLEIRAGAGGEEAALFAHSLWRMYSMYAARRGWRCTVDTANETELGGVKELLLSVEGDGVYSRLKYESGVHRVQRVPQTETQGRIHTSTVTVAVLPEAEEQEAGLDPRDVKFEVFRASGAGGQHINKTSSAVRAIHLPTGMVVECQDRRSQLENKSRALKILASRLLQQKQAAYDAAYNARRQSQVGSGERSEKIRTYNFPQDRVTDHRIGLTLHDLQGVLDGGLDRIIEPLILHGRQEKLLAQGQEM